MTRQFMRGARPTPRHKLAAARPHVMLHIPPPQMAFIPKQLDMWGNDTYGDCVTAEEAFAKACYSPEIFIPTATVVAWATKGGFRDGANLTDVMDAMKLSGFTVGSQLYDDGGYASVDYSNESVLQSALAQGPVKIGIDASALPSGAGNNQGWMALGGSPQQFTNEDHCVALAGYGRCDWLFGQLGVPLPAGLVPGQPGYLLYTWSTIGFVDHAWIMSTCGEAWLRTPTTVGVPPLPGPTPGPGPMQGDMLMLADTLSPGTVYSIPGVGTLTPNVAVGPGNYPLVVPVQPPAPGFLPNNDLTALEAALAAQASATAQLQQVLADNAKTKH